MKRKGDRIKNDTVGMRRRGSVQKKRKARAGREWLKNKLGEMQGRTEQQKERQGKNYGEGRMEKR